MALFDPKTEIDLDRSNESTNKGLGRKGPEKWFGKREPRRSADSHVRVSRTRRKGWHCKIHELADSAVRAPGLMGNRPSNAPCLASPKPGLCNQRQ